MVTCSGVSAWEGAGIVAMSKALAVITGSSSGIGEALRDYLQSEKGIYCIGGGRDFLDVSKYEAWQSLVEQLEFSQTPVDYLFLNAGVAVTDYDGERVRCQQIVATNLLGVYYGLYAAPAILREGGVVVVTASVSAYKPDVMMPLYGATKAACVSLVQSFGLKYAGKYRVFAVSPGFVSPTGFGGGGESPKELVGKIPVGHQMSVGELVRFIWSLVENGGYLCGSDIVIDGGWRFVRG